MKELTRYLFDDIELPKEFNQGLLDQVSPLVKKIAYKRGFDTVKDMERYLFGDTSFCYSETTMKDTDKALPILKKAIKDQELIVVYRDYDVDGCCAGALSLECIRKLGGKAVSYGNAREVDGYGICVNGIDTIKKLYPEAKILMTVDNGIVANQAIDYAKKQGFSIIVTDHHLPSDTLPNADAVLNIKRKDEFYPFRELCGTGVAFKLFLALADYMGVDASCVMDTIDLVGIATVCDVVPLVGENRDLVREGLKRMNEDPRPAIEKMQELSGVDEITSHTLGFIFGPMINALSRMNEDSAIACDALISDDEKMLTENVQFLIKTNNERKKETEIELNLAMESITEEEIGSSIILFNQSFQEGIIGIVAGRLKNQYHRPVVIFAPAKEGVWKASCRSIDGFHLKDNLDKIAHLMLGYGGHAKAAGLSIDASKFNEFKKAFMELTDTINPECFIEKIPLDDVLDTSNVTVETIQELRILEPYGEGNKQPIFGLRFHYDKIRYMGEQEKHVKYTMKDSELSIIEWNGGEKEKTRQKNKKRRTKVIGTLSLNEFRGTLYPQFIVD